MTLRSKAVTATFWLSAGSVISQGISYGSTLLLAVFLSPEEMGKAGIGLLIVAAVGLLREMGISRALVYYKGDMEAAADTGFILIPLFSAGLYLVVFAGADLAALFFRDPDITGLVRIMGLTLIINSLGEVHAALMEKNMQFDRRTIVEISHLGSYGIFVVLFAYLGFSFWSIAYADLISAFISLVFFWRLSSWRPRLRFETRMAGELLQYGRRIVESTIVNFCIRNIDDAAVGRMLGTASLGVYSLAYRIANIPATTITPIIGKIMFPVYTRLSDHAFDLRNAFLKSLKVVGAITIPLSVELWLLAPGAMTYAYGQKWQAAILPIQILTLYGLIRALSSGQGGIFMALNRVRIMTKISTGQLVILAVLLYPAIHFAGLEGVCWISVLAMAFSAITHYFQMRTLITLRHRHIVQALWLSVMATGLAAGGAYLLCIGNLEPPAFLILQPVITGFIYLPLMLFDTDIRTLGMDLLARVSRRGSE